MRIGKKYLVVSAQESDDQPELCPDLSNVTLNFDLVILTRSGKHILGKSRHTREFFEMSDMSAITDDQRLYDKLLSRPLRVSFVAFSPLTLLDKNGSHSGTDVLLWNAVGSHMGIRIKYVQVSVIPQMVTQVS